MKKPLPAEGQSVKFPLLERNLYIIVWFIVVGAAISGLAYSVYRFEARERENASRQDRQEQQAIKEHHAIEVQT